MAIVEKLATAPDVLFEDLALVSFIFSAARVGPVRAMLEGGASAKMLQALRGHLESLCLGYLLLEARLRGSAERR